MPAPLVATATGPDINLWPLAVVVAVLWAAGYVVACAVWPFTACGRCDGAGRHMSPSGRAWRRCRRCKGIGARLRYGRHVWNYFRRVRRDGTS